MGGIEYPLCEDHHEYYSAMSATRMGLMDNSGKWVDIHSQDFWNKKEDKK
jgi:hypothetical protein